MQVPIRRLAAGDDLHELLAVILEGRLGHNGGEPDAGGGHRDAGVLQERLGEAQAERGHVFSRRKQRPVQVVVKLLQVKAQTHSRAHGLKRLDPQVVGVVLLVEDRPCAKQTLRPCLLHGVCPTIIFSLGDPDQVGLEDTLFPLIPLAGDLPFDQAHLRGLIVRHHSVQTFLQRQAGIGRGTARDRVRFHPGS